MHSNFLCGFYLFTIILELSRGQTIGDNYYSLGDCTDTQDNVCKPGHSDSITISKIDQAEFKRCPKTTHLCLEKGSTVELKSSGRLFVQDYAVLNILQNGKFTITDKGICRITGRSSLEIGQNGSIAIHNGMVQMGFRAEIINHNVISIGYETELNVWQHSLLYIYASPTKHSGSLMMGESCRMRIAHYSVVKIYPNSQLRAYEGSEVSVEMHSRLHMDNGDISMGHNGELKVDTFTSLTVGDPTCYGESTDNRGSIKFSDGSKLILQTHSNVKVINGQILLKDWAELWTNMEVTVNIDGLLEISKNVIVKLTNSQQLNVGRRTNATRYCYDDASLIVTNDKLIPKSLTVYQGAHCFTKPGVKAEEGFDEKRMELKSDADTNEFKCFGSRAELRDAMSNLIDT